MVVRLDGGDPGSDLDHHTGTFVSKNTGEQPLSVGTRQRIGVSMADASGLYLHHHLARLGPLKVNLLDPQRLTRLVRNRSLDFHNLVPPQCCVS